MAIKIIGITDDTGTCECCGRTDLKRVVLLDFDGDIRRFGSQCAARALGRHSKKDVERIAEKAQSETDKRAAEKKFWAEFLADDARIESAFRTHIGNLSFAEFVAKLQEQAALVQ